MKNILLLFLFAFSARARGAGYFRDAAAYSESRGGQALLVVRRDATLFEKYAAGHSSGESHRIYSGTKSFWAVAAMAAVQDGLINLDEPASNAIAEWRGDPRKRDVTIRELLNFTDGLPPAVQLHGEGVQDRDAFAVALPVVAFPGQVFIYGPSHLQVFCEVLRRRLRPYKESPYHYLERKVLRPLGLWDVRHITDRAGNPLLATGFELTARQWVRFGELILHRGFYNRQLVDPDILENCFHGSEANPAFGIGFWLNRKSRAVDVEKMLDFPWRIQDWRDACISRDAPPDMIVSLGSGFQRLYIIPSLDLVVARQGWSDHFSDACFLRLLLADLRSVQP